ncbi:glycoside hydrolase family 32 protein [Agromyces sp. ISL-38]|uniref:glycoside hydrolase family 32 protein n=1 Tax=Agromyces sp. ISL-38 TaxID=2819107 RepID=UPI001BE85E70|nr:glycoside hydrolase family 32 protein [Agromyces sp. ISL-38]MBT2497859.1 glycoside hydrolase family 32 protein [Agromyces sp. ISL-38]
MNPAQPRDAPPGAAERARKRPRSTLWISAVRARLRARRWPRSLTWVIVAVAAATGVVLALVLASGGRSGAPAPTPEASAAPEPEYTRPADWSPYRPAVHLTPGERWMNDPQRPFWLDGRWHYYYLYNADYPDGNGTEWYHATSTDLVHWREEGVAIEKYQNGLGDIETGSAVIDTENTAGFGAGAVIAIMTQQLEGVQRQSLFVSTDGGFSFEPYDGNPVMDNPGEAHWRDPKIIWDDASGEWLMVLAEGDKVGFYASPDLKDWTFRSAFARGDLGILECPDLFEMSVDGDPSNTKWVLAAGVNGGEHGMTTGTAYWTGEWDGTSFVADDEEPAWLDRGADFYATVTWDDPRLPEAERLASRYAIGWLNNWAYAGDLPTDDWQGGADSIVREIGLRTVDGKATLVSTPAGALESLEGEAETRTDLRVTDAAPDAAGARLPQPSSDAYRLRLEVAPDPRDPASEVRVRIKEGDGSFATVGVDFEAGVAFVTRDADAAAADMPPVYRETRSAPAPVRDGVVTLDVIVDASSVEVFVNGGESALSSLVFGAPGANGLSIESVDGVTELHSLRLTPLAVAKIERATDVAG